MFRVAKKAVILTEPRDTVIDTAPFQNFRNVLKSCIGRQPSSKHGFETVGNYAYAISEREIEKFLLGMHYRHVAFVGCNDFYDPSFGVVPMQSPRADDQQKIRLAERSIRKKDFFCNVGIRKSTILTAALFKDDPEKEVKRKLVDMGWRVKVLPLNPYV
jgi:hypothetical protein